MILPGRMIHSAPIALVFRAQLAFGIAALGGRFCRRNGPGVFFRLRKVDGNIQGAIIAFIRPAHILFDAVAADIIAVLAELIIIIRGGFGTLLISPAELLPYLVGHRGNNAHQARVEQIPGRGIVLNQALFHCRIQQRSKDYLQVAGECLVRRLVAVLVHGVQQPVGEIHPVILLAELPLYCVVHQCPNGIADCLAHTVTSAPP